MALGPAGFIKIVDEHTIAYPDYRGNGVMASLGNMVENPHIGIFLATSPMTSSDCTSTAARAW